MNQHKTAPPVDATPTASGMHNRNDVQHFEGLRLDEQIGHLVRRVHQRCSAVFQARIGDEQITPTQFAALVKLEEATELSQNHLGRLTAMDPATTQGVIRRLLDRRLVATRDDADDRRRTLISLSPQGRALVRRLLPNAPEISNTVLAPLTPAERTTLVALLKRLG
ncbi:MAG TPA: MarR family winged helix-turn-helix transcriptional regulator [Candidatus Cybelea sp.]|nr:MarR family winged helix-turn-helix transcriptional regulator [Candidatus Cybelea sp.]